MLKDGSTPEDPRLDRLYEEDWNSLNYPVTALLEKKRPYEEYVPESFTWPVAETLDQGQEGACVGFGYAHEALARPNVIRVHNGEPVDAKFAREKIYWPSQEKDEWEGGSYPGANPVMEGTSGLAGAKTMVELGIYPAYYWALDLKQLALGVAYEGPAVMCVNWHKGMATPDAENFIHVTGKQTGGHCILCNGVIVVFLDPNAPPTWENVDWDKSCFVWHNSWGRPWGIDGECLISFRDVDLLLKAQGEACFPARA